MVRLIAKVMIRKRPMRKRRMVMKVDEEGDGKEEGGRVMDRNMETGGGG